MSYCQVVEPSAAIDSSKLANSVRCFKYEVKWLKSIIDTELRAQFAAVMALVKDRIDPSIISELREDIGVAKGAADDAKGGEDTAHSAAQGTEAAAQEAENNADGGKATVDKARETVVSEVPEVVSLVEPGVDLSPEWEDGNEPSNI
jgi:hypothetical protein